MNKTPALQTPLPQRVPFHNNLLSSLKRPLPDSTTTRRTVEPPRRVPLKMDSKANKGNMSERRTPAPPQRVNVDGDRVENDESVVLVTPSDKIITSSNFRRRHRKTLSRTSGSRTMEDLPGLDLLKKRLEFSDEGCAHPEPSDSLKGQGGGNDDEAGDDEAGDNEAGDNEAGDEEAGDEDIAGRDETANGIDVGKVVDGGDLEILRASPTTQMTEKEFLNFIDHMRKSGKKLTDKYVSRPLEEQNIFTSQSKPIFEQLKSLGKKSFKCKFDLTKEIFNLLSLQEAQMRESSEVYQALDKIREDLRKKIELLQNVETSILSLFTTSIKGAFSSAMDVKSVRNLAESVSAKIAARKRVMTSMGHSDSKVAKGKTGLSAEKQSIGSRLTKQNNEGTSMKLRSMTNAGKKTEAPPKPVLNTTTAKPKTLVPKPAPAKLKAVPVSKIPARTVPSTRKGKENIGKPLGAPLTQNKKKEKPLGENQEKRKVTEEMKGRVEEETEDVLCTSFKDLPTTPVTTKPVQRKNVSGTWLEKLLVRDHSDDDKNNGNTSKEMSPL